MTSLKKALLITGFLVASNLCGSLKAEPHEGPDPIAHWVFNARTVRDAKVEARLGPAGMIEGQHEMAGNEGGILLGGNKSRILITDNYTNTRQFLPTRDFTIATRFSINQRQPWGGVAGTLQDNSG